MSWMETFAILNGLFFLNLQLQEPFMGFVRPASVLINETLLCVVFQFTAEKFKISPVQWYHLISTLAAWNPYKRVQRNEPESFHLWARAGCSRRRQTWVPFITTNNLEQIRWSCICMISVCFCDSERLGFQLCCHSAQSGLTVLAVQPKMNSFEFLAHVTSCNWESWNKDLKAVAQICKTLTGVSVKRMISLKNEVWIFITHLYRLLGLAFMCLFFCFCTVYYIILLCCYLEHKNASKV